MENVLQLMVRLTALKRTARTGWNMDFPAGHKFKPRKIPDAESVADHTWGLAMFAWAYAQRAKLDPWKLVSMALVHDVAESITLDIVTAVLDSEERERVEAEKRRLEDAAMREIFLPMGEWGQQCYRLWQEYADRGSPEALLVRQLDKLEACIQALVYRKQGHELDPEEFLLTADPHVEDPELRSLLDMLWARTST